MKKIELSEHFTMRKMLIFSLPGIFQAFAGASFGLVDGYFVSNLLGLTPFVAVGLISPVFFMLCALGIVFGDGASALISKYRGEGDDERSKRVFTMTTVAMLIFGVIVGVAAAVLMPTFAHWVRADESNIAYCVAYGRTMVYFLPFFMVNSAYMSLWITAEKGWYGMIVAAINGALNVVLDWVFMGPLNMGVTGAALASSAGAVTSAVITLIYFSFPNRSVLKFTRFTLADVRDLAQICFNGGSSLVGTIAGNITGLLANMQLIRYIGEMGVAVINVFLYIAAFFMAILFGISTTTVTVAGYKYGEKQRDELDSLVKNNTMLTLLLGAGLCLLFMICAGPIANLYLGYDPEAYALSVRAIRIMSLYSILFGFNLFVSAFFTGLGNGLVSMIIAAIDGLAAPITMMYLIPAVFGAEAIWYASPAAMLITAVFCVLMLWTQYYRKEKLW